MNPRAGRIFLRDMKKPDRDDWAACGRLSVCGTREKSRSRRYLNCPNWPLAKTIPICGTSWRHITQRIRWNPSKNWVTHVTNRCAMSSPILAGRSVCVKETDHHTIEGSEDRPKPDAGFAKAARVTFLVRKAVHTCWGCFCLLY